MACGTGILFTVGSSWAGVKCSAKKCGRSGRLRPPYRKCTEDGFRKFPEQGPWERFGGSIRSFPHSLSKGSCSKQPSWGALLGGGGFRELLEARGRQFHLSWYLSASMVTSYGRETNLGKLLSHHGWIEDVRGKHLQTCICSPRSAWLHPTSSLSQLRLAARQRPRNILGDYIKPSRPINLAHLSRASALPR